MKTKSVLSLMLAFIMLFTSIPVMAADVAAQKEEVSILKGRSVQLETVSMDEITYDYVSSDETVATVNEKGEITAVAGGNCDITATAYLSDVIVGRKTTSVTVEAAEPKPTPDPTPVPTGITTFVFEGTKITVIEGTDKEYGIVNKAGDAVTASGTDTKGNKYYVAANGDIVAVEIGKKGGSYAFEGTAADSNISVKKEAAKDAVLYLNGLDMTSSYTAPIVIKKDSTAKVSILAVDGTINKLTDNVYNNDDVYTDNTDAENAVIKAKAGSDVTIGGTGILIVDGNGKNGIKAANKLTIEDVNLTVSAENNAIASDTEMTINSGTIYVEAGNDGIKSNNDEAPVGSITINSGDITVDSVGDCIVAINTVTINGGTFDLTAYDGYDATYNGDSSAYPSAKGIKAAGSYVDPSTLKEVDYVEENQLVITDGTFKINTPDDAIHSDGNVTITGGDFDIYTADDAIHAEYWTILGKEDGDVTTPSVKVNTCYEAIEGASIEVFGGDYVLYCEDDIINAANGDIRGWTYEIILRDGTFFGSTCRGDGYDSNTNVYFYGGTHVIMSDVGLGENNSSIDGDGSVLLSGATILTIGKAGMDTRYSTQSTNAYVTFGSGSTGGMGSNRPGGRPGQGGSSGNTSTGSVSIKTGDLVTIKDASGNTLFETTAYWDAHNNGRSASYVMYSSPDLTTSSSCTLYVNGTQTGTGSSGKTSGWSLNVTHETLLADERLTSNVSLAEKPELTFTYEFVSADDVIATVSDTGLITGVKTGNTTVIVKTYVNDMPVLIEEYSVCVYREWPFNDVSDSDWYYTAVEYVYDKDIMTGINDTLFAPLDTLTRAQFAVILHRMEGKQDVVSDKKFDDVEDNSWYTDAVLWAYENGIVSGYENTNKFGTHDNISREQLAVMMYRYAKSSGFDVETDADLSAFKDAGNVSGYAVEAMKWAVGNGIITGRANGTELDPNGNALRAECATMIQRFMK